MGKKKDKPIHYRHCYRVTYNDDTQRSFLFLDAPNFATWVIIEDGEQKTVELNEILPRSASIDEIKPHEIGRSSAAEVAQWMYEYWQAHGSLEQEMAAHHISEHFGPEFVTGTTDGGLSIIERVRRQFSKLHGGHAEFFGSGKHKYWE